MAMQPATTTSSTPRILLVGGDDVGLSVAARMLRARGYDVVQTRGEHAAQHCGQHVDLLVTAPDRKVIQDVRSKSGRIPVLLLERDASHVTTDVPRVAASLFGKVAPEQLVKAVRLACPREPAMSDEPPVRR
jgi:CheY-like chemotaxis protein